MDDANNNELEYEESIKLTKQPSMLQNGELQPHQIDSLNWMVTLYDLRLNGILADDMVSHWSRLNDDYRVWEKQSKLSLS